MAVAAGLIALAAHIDLECVQSGALQRQLVRVELLLKAVHWPEYKV